MSCCCTPKWINFKLKQTAIAIGIIGKSNFIYYVLPLSSLSFIILILYHLYPISSSSHLSTFERSKLKSKNGSSMCNAWHLSTLLRGQTNKPHLQSWKVPSFYDVFERNGLESQLHKRQASIHQRDTSDFGWQPHYSWNLVMCHVKKTQKSF